MLELKIKQPYFIVIIIFVLFIFAAGFTLHLFLMSKEDNDATAATSPAFFWREIIVQLIIWTVFLFLPGYFLSKFLIPKVSLIERIILSYAIAPAAVVIIDFFLIGALSLEGFETNEIFYETIVLSGLIIFGLGGLLLKKILKGPESI